MYAKVKASTPMFHKYENNATLEDYVYIQNNMNVAEKLLTNAFDRSCSVFGERTTELCQVQKALNQTRDSINRCQTKMKKKFDLSQSEVMELSNPKIELTVVENVPEYIHLNITQNF